MSAGRNKNSRTGLRHKQEARRAAEKLEKKTRHKAIRKAKRAKQRYYREKNQSA